MQEHWFTLKKIKGEWWNLNSLLRAPQPLSQFYLSAYLDTLRQQGYSIFVVQGAFPPPVQDALPEPGTTPGRWFTPEQVRTLSCND
jgi:ataxin-3